MSWNRIVITICILVVSLLNAKESPHFNEDRAIVTALFFEQNRDYEKSYEIYKRLFNEKSSEVYLLKEVKSALLLNKHIDESIKLLETYSRINKASVNVYKALLFLYQKRKDVDGILDTYKSIYRVTKKEIYVTKIIDLYIYKKDIDGAIDFLETNHTKDKLLYKLYMIKKDFSKALALLDNLYKADKNPKWLAEKGMLTFELAKDKNNKDSIKKALVYLKEAIELGNDDSIYLNYYGYILIDNDIDISKGIEVIKKALKQQPNNSYYIDSLAWGYYKINECKKAYNFMKRVVELEGLKEPEIAKHWSVIQKCK